MEKHAHSGSGKWFYGSWLYSVNKTPPLSIVTSEKRRRGSVTGSDGDITAQMLLPGFSGPRRDWVGVGLGWDYGGG